MSFGNSTSIVSTYNTHQLTKIPNIIWSSKCTVLFGINTVTNRSNKKVWVEYSILMQLCQNCVKISNDLALAPVILSTKMKWTQTFQHQSSCIVLVVDNSGMSGSSNTENGLVPSVKHRNLTTVIFPKEWMALRNTRY